MNNYTNFPNDNTFIPSRTGDNIPSFTMPPNGTPLYPLTPVYPAPCPGCGRCPVCGRGPTTVPARIPNTSITWKIDGSPEVQSDVHIEGPTAAPRSVENC